MKNNTPSDEAVVRQVQEGDILAFEKIVRRYQEKLVNFVFRILKDEDLSYDVSQDTFIKVYKGIEKIDTKKRFSTFIFEVAKNTALNYLRRSKKETRLDETFARDGDEYETLFREESERSVRKSLAEIAKDYGEVLKLYYFDELSYEEIGKKLRMPLNTVRTKLRRAKISLKEKIRKNEK